MFENGQFSNFAAQPRTSYLDAILSSLSSEPAPDPAILQVGTPNVPSVSLPSSGGGESGGGIGGLLQGIGGLKGLFGGGGGMDTGTAAGGISGGGAADTSGTIGTAGGFDSTIDPNAISAM